VRAVAHYFPQLHRIPENDRWWGEGFTDWDNVARARPLFPGHRQPRVPAWGRYDQASVEVLRRQVELARAHGVSAFCHYHYWFDGKQLLETPTNQFLAHKELDLGICLAWANETWSRRWDGQDHLVLIEQTHPVSRERWAQHFAYLQKAFTDPRALTIDGRPLFLIYRPQRIAGLVAMLEDFRERAHRLGLPGLYFVAMDQSRDGDGAVARHFDATVRFEPFSTYYRLRDRDRPTARKLVKAVRAALPAGGVNLVQRALDGLDDLVGGPSRLDYERVWDEIAARPLPRDRMVFPGAFVDWDNTARYRRHATLFDGATPAVFERGLRKLKERISARRPEEQLVFINAWNEWAEGAYLEPDLERGTAWLEAIERVVGVQVPDSARQSVAVDTVPRPI
jgi:hypothetical protein